MEGNFLRRIRKRKTCPVKTANDVETVAMNELRETPLSCWAFPNDLLNERSIVAIALMGVHVRAPLEYKGKFVDKLFLDSTSGG
jgi:hypothetical protein